MIAAVQREVTREVFLNFSTVGKIAFYVAAALAMGAFSYGAWLKFRKYRRGRADDRFQFLVKRLGSALGQYVANRTVAKRNVFVGLTHSLIAWGFVALFIGTAILTVDADILGIVYPAWQFFHGAFYRWYSVILDVLGLGFLVGLVIMAVRRGVVKPSALDYRRTDRAAEATHRGGFKTGDWVFLGLLFFIGITGFFLEGFRISGTDFPAFERWSPVGWWLAGTFESLGWAGEAGLDAHKVTWWVHGAAALGFVGYLPYSKAVHIVVDSLNLGFRDPLAGKRLPAAPENADHLGQRELGDFTWKQLMDFDACTKCGRCHEVCPAKTVGQPLSPRDVILDLRQHADASWSFLAPGHERFNGSGEDFGTATATIPGSVIGSDTLWACTTCLACVEACPVGIEHVPTIVGMRRSLVDQGDIEPMLQSTLESFGKQGNSFGKSARMRSKWTKELPFKIKDARKEPVDVLWYVGDYASYDEGVRETTRKVAHVFETAGLNFGILYEGERNTGNDVRRVGEEGLFEMLAEHNIAELAKADFKEIVTTDPHSLNALRNEYPEMGASYPTVHYTELLVRLINDGALKISKPTGRKVTFHDPCYLGRYNGVTEAPRDLIRLTGSTLLEMPRHGKNSFCCGAGGGRIWMDDSALEERPSENRIREGAGIEGISDFVVSCPKDLTMFRAAADNTGLSGQLVVSDVIDLVVEAAGINLDPTAVAGSPVSADGE